MPPSRFLESLSLAAWPALETDVHDGWTLAWADGMSRRNNSCWPLEPGTLPIDGKIDRVETFYRARGLPVSFKLPDDVQPVGLPARLESRGYQAIDETLVMVADFAAADHTLPDGLEVKSQYDDEWLDAYQSCFSMDARRRGLTADILEHVCVETAFFLLFDGDRVVGCGYGARDGEWSGLFGVGVVKEARGRGLGRALTAGMLAHAMARGARHAYLQVMGANTVARGLYESLGFAEAYRYRYLVK